VGLNRYYCPSLPESGSIDLPEEEVHHALRVRRETIGDECVLFDGQGHEATARFLSVNKRSASLELLCHRWAPRIPPGKIILGIAMPKGDRQREVIERAVELGAHRLVPLKVSRGVLVYGADMLSKWRRYQLEACKQCERNQGLEIAEAVGWEEWIMAGGSEAGAAEGQKLGGHLFGKRCWVAHPRSRLPKTIEALAETRSDDVSVPLATDQQPIDEIRVAIGPEGGFTSEELAFAFQYPWRLLDLGERILRVETAVAAVSLLAGQLVARRQGARSENGPSSIGEDPGRRGEEAKTG
jgi:16S rRNA (uracil1498-N3)-methyltransferase